MSGGLRRENMGRHRLEHDQKQQSLTGQFAGELRLEGRSEERQDHICCTSRKDPHHGCGAHIFARTRLASWSIKGVRKHSEGEMNGMDILNTASRFCSGRVGIQAKERLAPLAPDPLPVQEPECFENGVSVSMCGNGKGESTCSIRRVCTCIEDWILWTEIK